MKHFALLGLAFALAACPGPGEGGSRLIGTWDEIVAPTSGDTPGVATFRDDGTFQIDEDGSLDEGTFEEAGATLILETPDGTQELPYATDATRFTPVGLRHVGGGAGFEGQWSAEGRSNGEAQVMELVLDPDGGFTLGLGEDMFTGTWREEGGELITTLESPGGSADLPWHSIADAITVVAYERR